MAGNPACSPAPQESDSIVVSPAQPTDTAMRIVRCNSDLVGPALRRPTPQCSKTISTRFELDSTLSLYVATANASTSHSDRAESPIENVVIVKSLEAPVVPQKRRLEEDEENSEGHPSWGGDTETGDEYEQYRRTGRQRQRVAGNDKESAKVLAVSSSPPGKGPTSSPAAPRAASGETVGSHADDSRVPACMMPGTWLDDTAISDALVFVAALRPLRFITVDPLLVAPDKTVPAGYWQRLHYLAVPDSTILVPMNIDNAHWCLAAVKSREPAAGGPACQIFDSYPTQHFRARSKNLAATFLNGLTASAPRGGVWAAVAQANGQAAARQPSFSVFTFPYTPEQSDMIECGVAVIVVALHLAGNLPLPEQIDYAMWRDVLGLLAQHQHPAENDDDNDNEDDGNPARRDDSPPLLRLVHDLGADDDEKALEVPTPSFVSDLATSHPSSTGRRQSMSFRTYGDLFAQLKRDFESHREEMFSRADSLRSNARAVDDIAATLDVLTPPAAESPPSELSTISAEIARLDALCRLAHESIFPYDAVAAAAAAQAGWRARLLAARADAAAVAARRLAWLLRALHRSADRLNECAGVIDDAVASGLDGLVS
ncbi:hypothetical protein QBC33DRAFT_601343 [Phialemonium atrogriseum]|uniref:Ubiquitin-like protease family profile domain-containing protein n=1 Tax=Phialemonium atrogriseum TaxID=1093897 RepID=A0AAJ0BQP9_9PEZI|nr:uncharacterized protein QBC33DRAFT_601343 [Phialemonium atrogriseum]KAK1762511.1 hypothetical protein QBC33DRAFT_601343 [Phialemonium atrogriseum]